MSSGLLALLDDVSALVKVTAASVDDVAAQAAKTGGKVSGIVIDDAAVTPKYVVGLSPGRELSIIINIAKKSLLNKLVFLGPAALALGFFLPWLITPLLMVGGAYLCFEGYEKAHSILFPHHHDDGEGTEGTITIDPQELEKIRTDSAVRTDFILSAEIIAITYASVVEKPFFEQVAVMVVIAVAITVAVYGFVGLIVKADDIGLHMAQDKYHPGVQAAGRRIVAFMPHFLKVLSYIGTAAMLWVGAEIIAHGIPFFHHALYALKDALSFSTAIAWAVKAALCAIAGLAIGAGVEKLIGLIKRTTLPGHIKKWHTAVLNLRQGSEK